MDKRIESMLDEHEQGVKAVSDELQALEKQADALRTVISGRDAAEQELWGLEDRRSELLGERERLEGSFAAALFNADEQDINRIRDRRKDIDEQVKDLDAAIEQAQQELKQQVVDSKAIAELAVRAGLIQYTDPEDTVNSLRAVLQEQRELLRTRANALTQGLAGHYEHSDYQEARIALDPAYRSAHKAEERKWRLREERAEEEGRRFWGDAWDRVKSGELDISSSDAVHAARGQRRSLSPTTLTDEYEDSGR